MPLVAPGLPVAIPNMRWIGEHGPNGHACAVYDRIPGVVLREYGRAPSHRFLSQLGEFLACLHEFPIDKVPHYARQGYEVKNEKSNIQYQLDLIKHQVYPFVDNRTRHLIANVFAAFLDDDANFHFNGCFAHGDIHDRNLIIDPSTGSLAGVIDFSRAGVWDATADLAWLLSEGFMENIQQTEIVKFLTAARIDIQAMRKRAEFFAFVYLLMDFLYGIRFQNQSSMDNGLRFLSRLTETEFQILSTRKEATCGP